MLHSWYCSSQACVRMMGYYTQYVDICSGLKQGGILSPLFYNVYVDDLLKLLSCEKLGCTIGGIYYESIFNANDIVLLGASVRKMQKMIDIYYKYGNKYSITLNTAKTNWMYTNTCNSVSFDINGVAIQNVGLSIKYLSVNLTVCNNVLTIDIEDRIRKFNMAA